MTDERAIVAAAGQAAALVDGLDILINNTGVFPQRAARDAGRPSHAGDFVRQRGCAADCGRGLLDLLRRGQRPRIVNITSQLGSLKRRASGRCYSYCSSNATLNMLTRSLAFDLQDEGIIAVVVHPGRVQTDMGGEHAPVLVGELACGIIALADGLTMEQTSKFLTWDGTESVVIVVIASRSGKAILRE